jgi:tetratricopeptide (TPR) repeat protein
MHEDAAEEFRYVVKNVKDNYMVWEQLMFVENALGEYERLYDASIEAIKIFPMAPNLYLFKGIACIEKGNENEAIETLKRGLKIAGKNKDLIIQLYSMLGEAYRNKGQNHLSDDAFNKVLEIDKNNLYVLNNYSYYLSLREEKLEEALEMSKVCIEKEPESSTYLDTYAWILYKMKKYKEAKKYLELALKNNGSKNSEIVEHYGDVLFIIGEKETALEYWKKARQLGKISGELNRKISDVEEKNGNENH